MNRNRIAPPDGDYQNHMIVVSFLAQLHAELFLYLESESKDTSIFYALSNEWHSYSQELINCPKRYGTNSGHYSIVRDVDMILHDLFMRADTINNTHLDKVNDAKREIALCVEHYRIMY